MDILGVIGADVHANLEQDVLLTLLEGVVDQRGRAQISAIAAVRRIANRRGVSVAALFEPHEKPVARYVCLCRGNLIVIVVIVERAG